MARFLLADDSATVRHVLRAVLERLPGAQVHEAATASEAVRSFEAHRPDVVFLDMVMPHSPGILSPRGRIGLDHRLRLDSSGGLDALAAILRADPLARVALVTALPRSHPDVLHAIGLGAAAYLEKPVLADDVVRVARRLLEDAA